jgi:predicted nucleic acid-binding protein
VAAEYASKHESFTFTSVTVHEIALGLEFKGAAGQLKKSYGLAKSEWADTPTANDYLQAAQVRATARKQGAIVELPDCLIASVAIRLGLPLATGNAQNFQTIQKMRAALVIDNWRASRYWNIPPVSAVLSIVIEV